MIRDTIVGVMKKSLSQLEGVVVTNPWRELTSSSDGYSAVGFYGNM